MQQAGKGPDLEEFRIADARRVFLESRVDVRVRFGDASEPESTSCRTAGIASDADGETRRSAVPPDDVLSEPEAPDLAPVFDWIVRIRAAAPADLAVRGVWVESDQVVAVHGEDGRTAVDRRRGGRFRVEATVSRNGRTGGAVVDVVRAPAGLADPAAVAAALDRRARERQDATDSTPGEQVAVFDRGVGGILIHELIGHALEGDTLVSGASRLARESLRFRSDEVRVVEDPRRCRVPWTIDDEGEAVRPIGLVDRGRVVGCLLDRARARLRGQATTAHGRRASYLDDVRPRMGCTFLAAGRLEDDEILEDTAAGLFVRRMEAASTDPVAGTARFRVVDADRIVDGRIDRSLHPFLLEVRLVDLLDSLDRLGRTVEVDRCVGACVKGGQTLATSVGAPTIRVGLVGVIP
jgi:TldD protein